MQSRGVMRKGWSAMQDRTAAVGAGSGEHIFLQSLKTNSRCPSSRLSALFCFSLPALPRGEEPPFRRRSFTASEEVITRTAPLRGPGRTGQGRLPSRHWPVCRGATDTWLAAACSSFEQTELNEFHLRRPT